MPRKKKTRYLLDVELIEDKEFHTDEEFVILLANEWRVVESWLKICKKAGVLEDDYECVLNTTIWPLSVRPHTAFDA